MAFSELKIWLLKGNLYTYACSRPISIKYCSPSKQCYIQALLFKTCSYAQAVIADFKVITAGLATRIGVVATHAFKTPSSAPDRCIPAGAAVDEAAWGSCCSGNPMVKRQIKDHFIGSGKYIERGLKC